MNNYGEYVKYIHGIVKLDCSDMDAVYGDHIKSMIGVYGLNALLINNCIESCGVINGRHLYVICDCKDDQKE